MHFVHDIRGRLHGVHMHFLHDIRDRVREVDNKLYMGLRADYVRYIRFFLPGMMD